MKKKHYILLSCGIIILAIAFAAILVCFQVHKSYDYYVSALEKYNNAEFISAKSEFKKVSKFSYIKPAAIYREALCANRIKNNKEELKKYEQLKTFYSKSKVTPKALYTAAKIHHQNQNYNKALKEFKLIQKKYPKTKYSTAANYYIAAIESEKYKNNSKKEREIINKAKNYLIEAPDGIFAANCAKIIEKYTLSEDEKLLLGKTYLLNKNYDKALRYLEEIDLQTSWPYLVQIFFVKKDTEKVRNFTRLGMSTSPEITTKEQNNATYKAIDLYIKTFDNKKLALSTLLNLGSKNKCYDYLMYKNCQNAVGESQNLCYGSIYQLYPSGNFAAESLANVFYNKVHNEEFKEAVKFGKLHLLNYKKAKSTPKVLYWLAHVSKIIDEQSNALYYYNKLMKEYPDDYYTYLAFISTNNLKYGIQTHVIEQKNVEFPYPQSKDKFLNFLLNTQDYGFINMFYDDDDFIKSWLLYQEGDYSSSSRIARDAMDKLEEKPDKDDLRWRLVYPIHYYDDIAQHSTSATDKTLMLSIIREESYFNPNAKSPVGAIGLMQLMPKTAEDLAKKTGFALTNINLLYNPKINIKLGNTYFAYLKSLLKGKNQLAVLAYNGGIGSVKKWQNSIYNNGLDDFIENIPYSETQNYYKKVYRTYWNYLRIYNGLKF